MILSVTPHSAHFGFNKFISKLCQDSFSSAYRVTLPWTSHRAMQEQEQEFAGNHFQVAALEQTGARDAQSHVQTLPVPWSFPSPWGDAGKGQMER